MGRSAAAGRILGDNDCWIAACCVSHDLPLLTRNRKHFEPLEPLGLDLL
jgi:predicted nucleic acid-binding protein